jgi:hypothetical protein
LKQIVVVPSLAGIACLIDGAAGTADMAQAHCCAAVLEVKLCGVGAADQVSQAAFGQVAGLPGTITPAGDGGEIEPQLCHQRLVIDLLATCTRAPRLVRPPLEVGQVDAQTLRY